MLTIQGRPTTVAVGIAGNVAVTNPNNLKARDGQNATVTVPLTQKSDELSLTGSHDFAGALASASIMGWMMTADLASGVATGVSGAKIDFAMLNNSGVKIGAQLQVTPSTGAAADCVSQLATGSKHNVFASRTTGSGLGGCSIQFDSFAATTTGSVPVAYTADGVLLELLYTPAPPGPSTAVMPNPASAALTSSAGETWATGVKLDFTAQVANLLVGSTQAIISNDGTDNNVHLYTDWVTYTFSSGGVSGATPAVNTAAYPVELQFDVRCWAGQANISTPADGWLLYVRLKDSSGNVIVQSSKALYGSHGYKLPYSASVAGSLARDWRVALPLGSAGVTLAQLEAGFKIEIGIECINNDNLANPSQLVKVWIDGIENVTLSYDTGAYTGGGTGTHAQMFARRLIIDEEMLDILMDEEEVNDKRGKGGKVGTPGETI